MTATSIDSHLDAAITFLFDKGYVYYRSPGERLRATNKGLGFHRDLTGSVSTAEDAASDLVARRLDEQHYSPKLKHMGQGQRPGMIDSTPPGRRLLLTLIVLGALGLAGGAVLFLIVNAITG